MNHRRNISFFLVLLVFKWSGFYLISRSSNKSGLKQKDSSVKFRMHDTWTSGSQHKYDKVNK